MMVKCKLSEFQVKIGVIAWTELLTNRLSGTAEYNQEEAQ